MTEFKPDKRYVGLLLENSQFHKEVRAGKKRYTSAETITRKSFGV